MTKEQAQKLIDDHKATLANPADMVGWVWLRVIIGAIDDGDWEDAVEEAGEILSR